MIMKVAMMVRSFLETPVPNDIAYSPASVAQPIAEGLAQKGHQVTFFGPEGTQLNGSYNIVVETCGLRPLANTQADLDELVSTADLFSDYIFSLQDLRMAKEMCERASKGEFDCVIFNHFESAMPLASLFPNVQFVYILHDFLDEERRNAIEMHASDNQHFISISDSQRRDAPDLKYAATVYNGVDTSLYTFEEEAEDYLMFAGRITAAKGVREAVQVAMQANRRLLIAGSLSKNDYWYFDEYVKPFLNDKILFLGMLDREQLIKYYKKAAALLMPIQWQEPFGLSMAEANACGTPVIAFDRGSVPEIVVDGKTGFIVNNSAEMIMAINKLKSIRRQDCRTHIEKHFTREIMVENYESILKEIIKKTRRKPGQRRSGGTKFYENLTNISRQLIGE